ncbi:MAG: hypothetical protein JWQ68_1245 [Cryobacterium sp.]|jgi:hypothetical protein|nr:hypothetical protein [Cryobacterium sp.]
MEDAVIAAPIEGTRVHILRPRAHPFRQSTFAFIVLLAPIFTVLYWATVPEGTWLPVLAAQVVLAVALGLIVCAYRLTVIRVNPDGVTTRSWYGRTQDFPRRQIDTLVRLDLNRSSSLEPRPQIFLLDGNGELLIRMHGLFWSPETMDAFVDSLDVPTVTLPAPVTLRELDQALPGVLHPFERRLLERRGDE